MTEPFPTDLQLFAVEQAVFELLLECLLVTVVGFFVGAVILIIGLCCRETISEMRKKAPMVELDHTTRPRLAAGCGARWFDAAFISRGACAGPVQTGVGRNQKRRRAVALQNPRHDFR